MPVSLQWGGGLCPCFITSALAKLLLGRDCKPVMDELRRCCCQKLVFSFVSLKHFYVLESVLMTQSISGDNAAVPAFIGVCVCVYRGH